MASSRNISRKLLCHKPVVVSVIAMDCCYKSCAFKKTRSKLGHGYGISIYPQIHHARKRTNFPTSQNRTRKLFFAWHGSPLGNWHSILRVGLKNYSDTVHQRNGRAYGPGIYMAVDAGTSLGYAAGYTTWKNSQFGNMLKCVALCEVINYGSPTNCLGRVHRPNCSHCTGAPFYRIEAEEYVITRFFFIYSGTSTFSKNATELATSVLANKDYQMMSKKKK